MPAEERTDEDAALKALRAAAKGQRVLVILDDICQGVPFILLGGFSVPQDSGPP